MSTLMDYPRLVFIVSFLVLWTSAYVGAHFGRKVRPLKEEEREDFNTVEAATLTLLSLLVGFSFSMAISRYDQRKNLEEEEANAIGTEYVRVELLQAADTAKTQSLLKSYLDQRILFYRERNSDQLEHISASTTQLQSELWAAVKGPGENQPSAITGLIVAGMNDVLNSQGYTEAAWLNRIPLAAWYLMGLIAIGSNLLIGYGTRNRARLLFVILPLAVSISFFLVADIDSPRRGLISVEPVNLISLAQSLRSQ